MRIAMVSEHASPLAVLGGVDAGGQNVHVAALAEGLARGGHEVRVYTRRDSPDVAARVRMTAGVEVVHVTAGPATVLSKDEMLPHMPAFGRELIRHWRSEGPPDLVHAHFWMSGLASWQAGRATGVPVVQTFHALGSVKRRHQGAADTSPDERIAAESMLVRQVQLIIATCSDEIAELRELGLNDSARAVVVPCGVDTALFSPAAAVSNRFNRRAGASRDGDMPAASRTTQRRFRLLCLGRMVPRKGTDTVLAAVRELPDAELIIAGGPDRSELHDDPEICRLADAAARLDVSDRVSFTGRVRHDAVPDLIRDADVVVTTPWYEPFGIVPLEAMACGTPLVGSAVGGLLDSVADGVTGILVPPKDPGALVHALTRLRDDRDLRVRMGLAGRRRALRHYDWGAVARQTEAAYASVVADSVIASSGIAASRVAASGTAGTDPAAHAGRTALGSRDEGTRVTA